MIGKQLPPGIGMNDDKRPPSKYDLLNIERKRCFEIFLEALKTNDYKTIEAADQALIKATRDVSAFLYTM